MTTRIVLVSLFLSLLVACDKKEDDINPGRNYSGVLNLTYTRSFPTFEAVTDIYVQIAANGKVTLSNPPQVAYDGVSEKMIDGDRVRIREQGEIIISGISGEWERFNNQEYLEVNLNCRLEGVQTISNFVDYHWVTYDGIPYSLENPVECPMLFRIGSALMSESVCGGSCTDTWGYSCFRWKLVLSVEK